MEIDHEHFPPLRWIIQETRETGLGPPVKYFYWPFQGGTYFVDHLCYFGHVFAMLSRLFIAALWSPAGKGLTYLLSFVMFNCVFVTFSCGIPGHVWYLIVSIPDLCHISSFVVSICTKYWLTACSNLPRKNVVRWTDRPAMTIAVDWDALYTYIFSDSLTCNSELCGEKK